MSAGSDHNAAILKANVLHALSTPSLADRDLLHGAGCEISHDHLIGAHHMRDDHFAAACQRAASYRNAHKSHRQRLSNPLHPAAMRNARGKTLPEPPHIPIL